jgi:hypothetical protein
MSNEDLEVMKETIDHFIGLVETSKVARFQCPESHKKSYYLKCCHLIYVYQVGLRARPDNAVISKNLNLLKEWMPLLREAKI